jgi:hypothetical protein
MPTILLYEWIYSLKGVLDFVIVETGGVHLFKIDDEKNTLKEIKCFSNKISCCWFEPENEILVTTRYDQNGLISWYYFKEKKKDYKYK